MNSFSCCKFYRAISSVKCCLSRTLSESDWLSSCACGRWWSGASATAVSLVNIYGYWLGKRWTTWQWSTLPTTSGLWRWTTHAYSRCGADRKQFCVEKRRLQRTPNNVRILCVIFCYGLITAIILLPDTWRKLAILLIVFNTLVIGYRPVKAYNRIKVKIVCIGITYKDRQYKMWRE